MFGSRLCAVYGGSHFDAVEVNFEHSLFAPDEVGQICEIYFQWFSDNFRYIAVALPKEYVFDSLLSDAAASTGTFSCSILLHGSFHSLPVYSSMGVEIGIFYGHYGIRKPSGHPAEGYPLVLPVPIVCLAGSFYHEWGDLHRKDFVCHYSQHG